MFKAKERKAETKAREAVWKFSLKIFYISIAIGHSFITLGKKGLKGATIFILAR